MTADEVFEQTGGAYLDLLLPQIKKPNYRKEIDPVSGHEV
jgi:hypothetical protein